MNSRVLTYIFVLFLGVSVTGYAYVGNFTVDKAHSQINFNVKHMVLSKVQGNFSEYEIDLNFNEQEVTKSSVTAVLQAGSISTANEDRDNHLKGADFFAVEQFPALEFSSTKVTKAQDGYLLHGNLTMHGVTKEVQIPFKITGIIDDPWGNRRVGFEGHLTIDRQDYGISWSNTMDTGGLIVSNKVNIEVNIEAIMNK